MYWSREKPTSRWRWRWCRCCWQSCLVKAQTTDVSRWQINWQFIIQVNGSLLYIIDIDSVSPTAAYHRLVTKGSTSNPDLWGFKRLKVTTRYIKSFLHTVLGWISVIHFTSFTNLGVKSWKLKPRNKTIPKQWNKTREKKEFTMSNSLIRLYTWIVYGLYSPHGYVYGLL